MTVTATAPRMSVYRLMDDRQLLIAVADLERMVEQLNHARSPVAARMRAAYIDALLAARAECDRRRT